MIDRAELKAVIREVMKEIQREQDEQESITEYYAAEAMERRVKREARERVDAEAARQSLEDRVNDLERQNLGRRQ